jgi:hypothetical protein
MKPQKIDKEIGKNRDCRIVGEGLTDVSEILGDMYLMLRHDRDVFAITDKKHESIVWENLGVSQA